MSNLEPVRRSYLQVNKKTSKVSKLERFSDPNLTLSEIMRMRGSVSSFASALGFVSVPEKRELAPEELNSLMLEAKALDETILIAQGRREAIKNMVFNHFDSVGQVGQTELVVGDKKFKREGGGSQEPSVDPVKLKEQFPDNWQSFMKESKTYSVDDRSLQSYIEAHPQDMEKLRDSLTEGKTSSFKFAVRDVVGDDEQG